VDLKNAGKDAGAPRESNSQVVLVASAASIFIQVGEKLTEKL
jgi:hypothetical protein